MSKIPLKLDHKSLKLYQKFIENVCNRSEAGSGGTGKAVARRHVVMVSSGYFLRLAHKTLEDTNLIMDSFIHVQNTTVYHSCQK